MKPERHPIKKILPEIVGFALTAAIFVFLSIKGSLGAATALVLVFGAGAFYFWLSSQTERRCAEQRREILLRERDSRRLIRQYAERALAIEKIPDPLILLDKKRRVAYLNVNAEELFGKNLEGKAFSTVFRDSTTQEAIRQTLKDGKTRVLESTIAKPSTRFFETSVTPIAHEDGETLVVINFHEITDLKHAHQMRTDFVANAGHELKTPLTSLLGFIETLQGPASGDAGATEKFLSIMHSEANRMVHVIEDLLSLSRIEAQQHLHPTDKVKLPGVLKSVASSLEHAAKQRGIKIILDVPTRLTPVTGDKDQVFQLFQNLVSNAIKYGRVKSEVRIFSEKVARVPGTGKAGVAIFVADQGEGIPAEHLPRLTERFYRVDAARSRKVGGTGLGLAIVKHITTRHRGRLDFRSEVGKGTTVKVTLPGYKK